MQIKSLDPAHRIVEEYEFAFNGGQVLPIIVDRESGDTVDFETHGPIAILIKLKAKASLINPNLSLPAEEITLFQTHLIAITKRFKEVADLTVEQQEEWKQILKEATRH